MIAIAFLFVCVPCDCFKSRRRLEAEMVTENLTAEWLARQITEAFPWDTAPKYLIRDNDRATLFHIRFGRWRLVRAESSHPHHRS